MKSFILTSLVVVFAFSSSLQAQFAVEAGYNSNGAKVELLGVSETTSGDGEVYFGASYDISLSDKMSLQPALLYSRDAFQIPVSLKLALGSSFHVMAGPSILMITGDETEGFNNNAIGYNAGVSLNLSDKLAIIVRYAGDLGNRLDDDGSSILGDVSIKYSQLKAGLSYSF